MIKARVVVVAFADFQCYLCYSSINDSVIVVVNVDFNVNYTTVSYAGKSGSG
jgi:acyl-coenzyme A thioesterase PaaI-like protein